MKNFGLIAFIVLVIGGLVAAVFHFKQEAANISRTLETERYSRLVAEEKAVNSASKIRQLEADLKSNADKIAKVQAVLKEQKSVNKDLESQYQRLSRSKAQLEDQLKTVISQPPVAPVVEVVAQDAQPAQ